MPLPVSLNVLSIAAFLAGLAYIIWRDRDSIERYSIVFVRRTKRGIHYLDRAAALSPRLWRVWATLGVAAGFAGMIAVFVLIVTQTLKLFLVGGATPPVGPVLPTVSTVTTPQQAGYLGLPFWHFMIALSVVLVVHEMMHGVIARVEGFDIEYVGLLLIGIIPGAFVQPEGQRDFFEPGEGEEKSSPWRDGSPLARLRVLAAGPFANVTLAAILFLALSAAFTTAHGSPELRGAYRHSGMQVLNVSDGSPAARAGLERGMTITAIDGSDTLDLNGFKAATSDLRANETVTVTTRGNGTFEVRLERRQPSGNITYTPAPIDYVLPYLEQVAPGTIDAYEDYNDIIAGSGDRTTRIGRWRWVRQHYDRLDAAATDRIRELRAQDTGPAEGYMGILVAPATAVKDGAAPFIGPLMTAAQVVFFIALLNLMIGIANLLPVKGLDGGWMLDTVLQEYMPGRADVVVRWVSLVTVATIGISFAFLIAKHLL
ncbi:MAG: site-2 protease family protein [Candidatus Nanohaloarchaea archaeon]|nr:site-2 protease family protein [Candidatus Nanohaloarchaea archaeon]